jgi:hypothetical protein
MDAITRSVEQSDLFPAELAAAQAMRAVAPTHPYEPGELAESAEDLLLESFDDDELYGELDERIDWQTGYVEER